MDDLKAPRGKFLKVRALIDSGADDIFLDSKLIVHTVCPQIAKPAVGVKTTHALRSHEWHRAQFVFPDLGLKMEVEAINAEFQDGTRAYSAILGTSFLELGVLLLNPTGESHFTFHDDATTKPLPEADTRAVPDKSTDT